MYTSKLHVLFMVNTLKEFDLNKLKDFKIRTKICFYTLEKSTIYDCKSDNRNLRITFRET